MQEGSFFCTPSQAFIVCRLFYAGHSDRCEVISHCRFDCVSLIMSNVEHLFMCAGHLYVFFGEMSVAIFCSFTDCVVFSILSVMMSCLYILEINPLSVSSFANIFSHSEGCHFFLSCEKAFKFN